MTKEERQQRAWHGALLWTLLGAVMNLMAIAFGSPGGTIIWFPFAWALYYFGRFTAITEDQECDG